MQPGGWPTFWKFPQMAPAACLSAESGSDVRLLGIPLMPDGSRGRLQFALGSPQGASCRHDVCDREPRQFAWGQDTCLKRTVVTFRMPPKLFTMEIHIPRPPYKQ